MDHIWYNFLNLESLKPQSSNHIFWSNRRVSGNFEIRDRETCWQFIDIQYWKHETWTKNFDGETQGDNEDRQDQYCRLFRAGFSSSNMELLEESFWKLQTWTKESLGSIWEKNVSHCKRGKFIVGSEINFQWKNVQD